ncbi:cytochrome P450 [Streptomyces naphthomycinicus]|uniref:cytochrome P450 n=1 Tax=Streptomyces naphthomycinicus TaxID=2872625 RepID=UPI001CECCA88|nr:cytochrome P450 [Streptomyces sp. TML10]
MQNSLAALEEPDVPKGLPIGPLPIDCDPDDTTPIRWVRMPNGAGCWAVSDYRLARQVLADPRFSRAAALAPDVARVASIDPSPDSIISLDGTAHARLRRIVAGAFTERRVTALRPVIEDRVRELLDELAAGDQPADLVAGLAAPLPLSVLCHMLGIPVTDQESFREWVPVLFDLDGAGPENRARAFRITHYMAKLIGQKRREPGDDLISALIQAADTEGRLTNRELVTLSLSLLMAGYDSTADQITLAFLGLLHDPARADALRADPGLVPAEVEELLQTNSSAPLSFSRAVTEPVRVADVTIRPGEPVLVFLLGANRGLRRSEGTPAGAHLAFGHGVHRCLGAPLARLQLATVIRLTLDRFPRLELAEDVDGLHWKPAAATRGLTRLHVRC